MWPQPANSRAAYCPSSSECSVPSTARPAARPAPANLADRVGRAAEERCPIVGAGRERVAAGILAQTQ